MWGWVRVEVRVLSPEQLCGLRMGEGGSEGAVT